MNYATIKNCDIANGPGVRVSVFVSGCTRRCKDCFNREAWDFYFPGVYMRDEMVVGVTASGLDHKKAKRVREEIQNALEKVLGEQDEDEER